MGCLCRKREATKFLRESKRDVKVQLSDHRLWNQPIFLFFLQNSVEYATYSGNGGSSGRLAYVVSSL